MKKLFVASALAITALSTTISTTASARDAGEIYTECGIGGAIFSKYPVLAGISNVIWDLGTTAVSSNLSSPETCSGGKAAVAALIHESTDAVESDLAAGEGDYLTAMYGLTACEGTQAQIEAMRKDLQAMESTDKVTRAQAIYNSLVTACSI